MHEAWDKLKPKDNYRVKAISLYNGQDYRTLSTLYLPIIGATAFSLITLFLTEAESSTDSLKTHSSLLDKLDISLPTFYQARLKLEAVGLLKAYTRTSETNHQFLYIVQVPITPDKFLNDDLLSMMLLDRIGQTEFNKLTAHYESIVDDLTHYVDVTANFVKVFPSAAQSMVNHEQELANVKAIFKNMPSSKEEIKLDSQFDWEFFMATIANLGLEKKQFSSELKRVIESFHQLYGINELEMQTFIMKAADYVTNLVDIKKLKQAVYTEYHKRKKQQVSATETPSNLSLSDLQLKTEADKATLRYNTLLREGYSEPEIEVIKMCDQLPPMVFLQALKEQRGGFVSSNERWLIENLTKQSSLPNSVINMLIHYMLVVQDKPSLNQNIANSIANDWAQSETFSPELALTKVKNYQEKKANQPKPKTYRKNQSVRKETLPDWANSDVKKQDTPMSKEELAFFDEQIKRIQEKKAGDS
ncbi:hypothetical protein CBF34_06865 [Vagococcus penaei]|uniref:Uncharacterized protein n=1 Tax=Vagococcus penaei TaxID=633807 RepID=A0A1Q2D3I1_9ENTE|nr:DnaD domain protein [Vagococcus penaei]AQP52885.1 hypothetical protein BW732_00700 [Vagococcus penaei]RSU01374.1 hypothetical protein CBF34_06865 [Vagococcus penaei]